MNVIGISFLVYAVVAFILLWLGLRWPVRRSLLAAILVGLVVDGVADFLVTRMR